MCGSWDEKDKSYSLKQPWPTCRRTHTYTPVSIHPEDNSWTNSCTFLCLLSPRLSFPCSSLFADMSVIHSPLSVHFSLLLSLIQLFYIHHCLGQPSCQTAYDDRAQWLPRASNDMHLYNSFHLLSSAVCFCHLYHKFVCIWFSFGSKADSKATNTYYVFFHRSINPRWTKKDWMNRRLVAREETLSSVLRSLCNM